MKRTNNIITIANVIAAILLTTYFFIDRNKQFDFFGEMSFIENGLRTKRLATVSIDNDIVNVQASIFQKRKLIATTDARFKLIYNASDKINTMKKVYDLSHNHIAFQVVEIYKFSSDCLVLRPKGQASINNMRFVCLE